ncbi:MAG: hypothetical protein WC994_07840 [Brumimicrobium sp.]
MIKLFLNNQSPVLVLIPIFTGIHLLLGYYHPSFELLSVSSSDNLWGINFTNINYLASKVLVLIFISINAIFLNFIFNTFEFFERLTYIPSVLYILILFLFPTSLQFNEIVIAHLFFLLSFYQLLKVRQNEDARNFAFLSGFFLGIAISFIPAFFVALLIILIGIFTIRPFNLRELILPLAGIGVIFFWLYLFVPDFSLNNIQFESNYNISEVNSTFQYVVLCFLGLYLLFALKRMIDSRRKSSVRFKKINYIVIFGLLILFLTAVLLFLIYDTVYYFPIAVVLVPFILAYLYIRELNRIAIRIFYSMFYILIVLNIIKFLIV